MRKLKKFRAEIAKLFGVVLFMTACAGRLAGQGLSPEWKTCSFPDFHFSMESPVALERMKPLEGPLLILGTGGNDQGQGEFNMLVTAGPLAQIYVHQRVRLKDMPKRLLGILGDAKGLKKWRARDKEMTLSDGTSAIVTRASGYDRDGLKKEAALFNALRGGEAWMIIIRYAYGSQEGSEKASRIINSFKLSD